MHLRRTLFWFLVMVMIGGCSGAANHGGSPEGAATGIVSGPVDIPVTIAKAEIDPFSVHLVPSDSHEVGILTGTLAGDTCDEEVVIEATIAEKGMAFTTTTEDCRFEFPLDADVKNSIIALAVQTIDPSVFVQITGTGDALVFTSLRMGIQSMPFALKADGDAVSCVADDKGMILEKTSVLGGASQKIADVTRCPTIAGFAGNVVVAQDGEKIISYAKDTTEDAPWKMTIVGTTKSDSPSLKIGDGKLAYFSDTNRVVMDGKEFSFEGEMLDWKNTDTLLFFQQLSDGTMQFQEGSPDGAGTAEPFSSDCRELSCNGNGTCFAACQEGEKFVLHAEGENRMIPVLPGREAKNIRACSAGAVFEADGEIAFYDALSGQTSFSGLKGFYPQCEEDDHVAFLCSIKGGLQICVHDFNIPSGAKPTAFALAGPTETKRGVCSGPFTVTTVNSSGSPKNVTENTDVALSGNGSGIFYSDSGCKKEAGTPVIASGNSQASLYFKDNTAEHLLLKASGALESASLSFKVNAASPTHLSIAGLSDVVYATCNLYYITAKDDTGTASAVSTDTQINLSGSGHGAFYAGSSCKTENMIGSVTLPKDSQTTQFYFKDFVFETVKLVADDTGPLDAGILDVTVTVK